MIAADFASEQSRLSYVSPGPMTFPDPVGDHDAAPDITAVSVSDTKGGWITIRATVANLRALPPDRGFVIGIDRDRKADHGRRRGGGAPDVDRRRAACPAGTLGQSGREMG